MSKVTRLKGNELLKHLFNSIEYLFFMLFCCFVVFFFGCCIFVVVAVVVAVAVVVVVKLPAVIQILSKP